MMLIRILHPVSRAILVLMAVLSAMVLSSSPAMAGEAPTPGFMVPEVLAAAQDIGMTDEQKPLFRAAVGKFVEDRMKALQNLMRKNNQTNIDRKFRSRTNSLLKKLDKDVAEFLTEEQMGAYKVYRERLKANLQGM